MLPPRLLFSLFSVSWGAEPDLKTSSRAWLGEVGVYAGAEVSERIPVGQVYALGAERWMSAGLELTLAYGGDLRAGGGATPWIDDLHQASAVCAAPASRLGGGLLVQGSAAGDRWGEAGLVGRATLFEADRARADLQVGGLGRTDADAAAPGVLAQSDLLVAVSPRVALRGHLEGREFWGAPGVGLASSSLSWTARPRVTARADLGVEASWGQGTGWADQVAPGSWRAWARMSAEFRPGRGLSTMGEVSTWTPAASAAAALAGRAGLSWRGSGLHQTVAPAQRTLRLVAPEAAQVELLASFLDWKPAPMSRQPDGSWTLTLTLPPGIHQYMYRVDGALVTPPEAEATELDDFGLKQGVVVVAAP